MRIETNKLDKKNKIILAHLMTNCRTPTTKLAKISNLSQPSIVYRIKNLEKNNFISKYDVLLNYNKFPLKFNVFMITIPQKKEKEFEKYCQTNKNIMSAVKCINNYNYSLTTFTTKKEINKIITYLEKEKLHYTNFNEIKSYFQTLTIFDIPIKIKKTNHNNETIKLDKNDIKILETLSNGGAKDSILKISKKTKIPIDIVLYRYKKLKKANYLKNYIAQINPTKFHLNYTIILFKTKNITQNQSLNKIKNLKKSIWIGQINENEYLITIVFKDYKEYLEILNKIYNNFENKITKLETFPIKNWIFLNRINLTQILK